MHVPRHPQQQPHSMARARRAIGPIGWGYHDALTEDYYDAFPDGQ